jgi:tRNA (cytidine32/uridine32-2'-O)-methyltransferase
LSELNTNIRFVLIDTAQPGNIGAAARAIKNMGFGNLVLVAPQVFPADRAVWRAAGATDVLSAARVVDSLDEAIAGCHLVIGTSARDRRIPWPIGNARDCAAQVIAEPAESQVAILFGREHSGLTNDELQRCHLHLHIPAFEGYSSLNIAAAVQVVAYELRMAQLVAEDAASIDSPWDEPMAKVEDLEHMLTHMEQVMTDSGFLDPDNPRQTLTRVRRLFTRLRLDSSEVAILRGLLRSVEKD